MMGARWKRSRSTSTSSSNASGFSFLNASAENVAERRPRLALDDDEAPRAELAVVGDPHAGLEDRVELGVARAGLAQVAGGGPSGG